MLKQPDFTLSADMYGCQQPDSFVPLAERCNKTQLTLQTQLNVFEVINESGFLPLVLPAPACCHAFAHLDQACRLATAWQNRLPRPPGPGAQLMRGTDAWTGGPKTLNAAHPMLCAGGCKYSCAPNHPTHPHPFSLQLSHDSLSPNSGAGVAIVSCSYVEATVH